MDSFYEVMKVLFRIFTILPLLLMVTLLMGKRSIGELPVFDFLIVLVLGSVVGADIAEPKVNHLYTAIAVVAIALLQIVITYLKIKNRRFGKLLTFEPTIVIYKGQFLVQNMKRIRFSIDNILPMLRVQNIFNVKDVELAIIEANGELSVQSKETPNDEITPKMKDQGIELPVIIEGKTYYEVLKSMNLKESWLHEELSKKGVRNIDSVFYAAINKRRELHISLKNDTSKPKEPLIYH